MNLFDKRSAFHPEWGVTGPPPEAPAPMTTEQGVRAERTAQVKTGVVEIPRRDLEEIVLGIRQISGALDIDDDGLREYTDEYADRLASYFKG